MKKILFFMLIALLSIDAYAQELEADDFVVITQKDAAYPGFNARTYRGLFPVGHGQFKMFNYGGTPDNLSALGANETLGSFVFNGYDGSQNVISAVIQAKTITDSRDPRFNFLLSNGVGNQRPNRMTIIGQSGHVGIGVTVPTERLDVNGSIRMRAGAVDGYVPVSDADGKMIWTDPETIGLWDKSSIGISRATGQISIGSSSFLTTAKMRISNSDFTYSIRVDNTANLSGFLEKRYAVYGVADNEGTNGSVYGIRGKATGSGNGSNYGLYGEAEGDASYNYGIYAEASGGGVNYAAWFDGETRVDDGKLTVTNDGGGEGDYAISGSCTTGATESSGVRGYANTSALYSFGVHGEAYGSAFTNYGIYGTATGVGDNFFNYAGYFSGNVTVTGTFANPSDAKLKKNVAEYENALEAINQLGVKTYEYKIEDFPQMNLDDDKQIGIIAQEIEKVLPHLVNKQSHPQKAKKDEKGKETIVSEAVEYKAVNYIGLIPILTQGIKELTEKGKKKDETINDLKSELLDVNQKMAEMAELMDKMNDKINQMEKGLETCSNTPSNKEVITAIELNGNIEQAILEQNAPNPFNTQTQIRYYIPSSAVKAQVVITDNRGARLKTVNLSETGFGTVFIKAGELAPGTYAYTLFVDGSKVATKQMVLIR